MNLSELTFADFTPHLHEAFCIRLEGRESIDLELIKAAELPATSRAQAAHRAPFSIEFLGPISHQYLQQQIYRLEHRALGPLDIFLVPLGLVDGRMRYEAIFT